MGLVIFITVPIGAVRCNTNFFVRSKPASSIQVATPFSFFSYRPNLLEANLFALLLSCAATAVAAESWLTTGFGGITGCGGGKPDLTFSICPGTNVVEVKPLTAVISSTVEPKRLAIENKVSPAETLYSSVSTPGASTGGTIAGAVF